MTALPASSTASRVLDVAFEDGNGNESICGLFHPQLPVKSLAEALIPAAEMYPELAASGRVFEETMLKARHLMASHGTTLTVDETGAIVLYTTELVPRERSPYYMMNEALRDHSCSEIAVWRDYIWLLLHALKKLPPSPVRQVVRGCKRPVSDLGSQGMQGARVTWSAFSSTATTVDVLSDDSFLGQSGSRTMFMIELTDPFIARDVQMFSPFPGENEVLLPPGVCFEVTSVLPQGDMTIVQCKQVKSTSEILDISLPVSFLSHLRRISMILAIAIVIVVSLVAVYTLGARAAMEKATEFAMETAMETVAMVTPVEPAPPPPPPQNSAFDRCAKGALTGAIIGAITPMPDIGMLSVIGAGLGCLGII